MTLVEPTNSKLGLNQALITTVSQVHKLIYFLLTGPDFNYKDVRLEAYVDDCEKPVDIYVVDAGLCIEIDGPCHFYNRKSDADEFKACN